MTSPDDEFYIGYEPVLPPGIRGRLRVFGAWTAAALVAGVVLVLLAHPRLGASRFDYGHPIEVAGIFGRDPYPAVTVDGRRAWLVGRGKHGSDAVLAQAHDGPVRLRGTPIARGAHAMLEVVPGTVAGTNASAGRGGDASAPGPQRHESRTPPGDGAQDVTLAGEIVDSKCFLGVMNPGEGPVHRDCAALCLRGGIPPMLLVRPSPGAETLVLLVSRDGQPMSAPLAPMAGLPVEVRGRLVRDDRGLVLAADVGDYRLLTR